MHAFQVAAENKHLIGLQLRYLFRRKIRSFDSIVRSHIKYDVTKKTGKAAENLRFCDHVLMAVIAKSEGTFHQEHKGSHIQSNGNNNLKHSSNCLTSAKLMLACAKTLPKLGHPVAKNEAFLHD